MKCGMVSWPSLGTSASSPSALITIFVVSVSSTTMLSNAGLSQMRPPTAWMRSKLKKMSASALLVMPFSTKSGHSVKFSFQ